MTTEPATKIKYRIGGMDCASCVSKIENAVSRLPGVEEVGVSLASASMTVRPGPDFAKGAVERQVKALGYAITADDDAAGSPGETGASHADLGEGPWWKTKKAILTATTGAALALTYIAHLIFPAVPQWIFVPALAVGLIPVARRAVVAATTGTPFSIEMLMTIAAVGALFIGAAEEAVAVVFLFLAGELLEGVAASRARTSIRGLADLVPKTAIVETNGTMEEVPADTLALGAIILVRPGDRIAADGTIVDGSSAINEAPVTGESVPKQKTIGDAVFAGTINTDAVLRIKVTAVAGDNTIARVIRLVEEAQDSKAPTQRFIDTFSTYYTPAVLVVAALVAILPPLIMGGIWSEWIYKGLAILLIGCPCALVISTPAAIAAGLSAGARRGLLIKGGAVIETLRKVALVALDKTGTLTEGKPKVTDIVPVGRPEGKILSMAAALESGSSHPLAVAILERAKADKVPVPPAFGSKAIAGKGVSGSIGGEEVMLLSPKSALAHAPMDQTLLDRIDALNGEGKTVSVLVTGRTVAGLIAMRDEPRDDAIAGLRMLKDDGIDTLMLTGDNERTARAIGSGLGIEVRAGLMPKDKQTIVRERQAQGLVVAKVGDGINDAPALAAADIGIAMGGGTDIALETADAAILHGRVADIANMVALSRATMGNIWQNITVALSLKAVFLVTTIIGVTGLWPAILADTGATVLVTMNAMRLLAWKGQNTD
ncbi:heavy metal translocating P-type ATPase [Shinella zoogloeoides]|uniref:P-type Zn(2+) transporter n=1 Tax=Shinella zoogloeoides TaxID=352475 RepID=A0A6N8TG33_SHIZO|nr:heavy metal translocating P-type ATPase [Shinella zoogloeoides]MXO01919.1 heavy metal translocating P-type ATPase [Shinella zoogloeoides]UEX84498.1 heavy metal translocating P-type ATPase [Shinella zoogloeoides]